MTSQAARTAVVLMHDEPEARVTAILADKISRAFLIEDIGARAMALDFNARLVTELRLEKVWPRRLEHPCGEQA